MYKGIFSFYLTSDLITSELTLVSQFVPKLSANYLDLTN